jgi:hypothetical protein
VRGITVLIALIASHALAEDAGMLAPVASCSVKNIVFSCTAGHYSVIPKSTAYTDRILYEGAACEVEPDSTPMSARGMDGGVLLADRGECSFSQKAAQAVIGE